MNRHSTLIAFVAGAAAALLFALYTNHVWEDYYITYRSSRNLATGNGLVFNVGDRLHTFTSPLGVLLPALSSVLTGNSSDVGALWIFRVMSACALGGAIALVVSLGRRLAYPAAALVFVIALLATDAKALDFTINGMETGFMLLFLAYAIWANFGAVSRRWLHVGAAWAGMMWSRPDSFIYIALVAIASLFFNDPARTGCNRRQILLMYLKAAALTTVLYGPWFVWAWWYYGSPIPHTIIAKGAVNADSAPLHRLLGNVWQMPVRIWTGNTSAEGAFLPSYFMFPSWPAWMLPFGRVVAIIASSLWFLPKMRMEVRVASFAYFGAAAYLSFVPYFPFPWYFPSTTLLAYVALAGLAAQLFTVRWRWVRGIATGGAVTLLAGALFLTFATARQMKAQQELVETGNRRVIGEWLKEHAQPGDTVFMEPLGYIGFFSGLKTYDWPGMSSREVTQACRLVGTNWENLIRYLQPTWLVMRGTNDGDLPAVSSTLANHSYERIRDFDRSAEIQQLDVCGRALLEFDSRFVVYKLKERIRQDADGFEIASPFGSSLLQLEMGPVRLVHAPGTLIAPIPAAATTVSFAYGFNDGSWEGEIPTDGATFEVWLVDAKKRHCVFSRKLEPTTVPADRGFHFAEFEIPRRVAAGSARLVFETVPLKHNSKDWTCWTEPRFQ